MPNSPALILCTCPDRAAAEKIARHLVAQRLAACVNIVPGLTSIYTWQGQVETADEQLLLIKSLAGRYESIEQTIRALHPYELPEIIALPIERGLPDYLNWIASCVTSR